MFLFCVRKQAVSCRWQRELRGTHRRGRGLRLELHEPKACAGQVMSPQQPRSVVAAGLLKGLDIAGQVWELRQVPGLRKTGFTDEWPVYVKPLPYEGEVPAKGW